MVLLFLAQVLGSVLFCDRSRTMFEDLQSFLYYTSNARYTGVRISDLLFLVTGQWL